MTMLPEIRKSIGKPSDIRQWNELCRINGNLQQSSYYDAVQAYFRQHPVYLEIWQENTLLGGSKFYVYIPGKLTRFTAPFGKYFLQVGESVSKNESWGDQVFPQLIKGFADLLDKGKPVWYTSYGYFNRPDYMIYPSDHKASVESVFANSFISLDKTQDQLWENIHPHHKHKIMKAGKMGYTVELSGDIKLFLDLLASTYERQSKQGPNPDFVRTFYRTMEAEGLAGIYVAQLHKKPVSAAIVTHFGRVACYAFGGSERNNDGASHLLHWELIKTFARENYSHYYLGQVATDDVSGDQKFLTGISPFKRRFGTLEVKSSRKTFIFKPYSYQLWKMISLLAGTR